jgi:hypothetical protein
MSVIRSWRIAVHESGHATVARLLRLPGCGEASIEEPNAHAVFPNNCGTPSVCALMAGAASEIALFGDCDEVGISIDAQRVWKRLRRYGYEDADPWWNYTLGLVCRHRSLITRVAIKLRRAGMLDGPDLDRLVWRG